MPVTRTTTQLLDGLHDLGDDESWRTFDARYRPIIIGVARRIGLDENSAADIAQEVIVTFVEMYRSGKYHRERGRLRSWLIGIAKNKIAESLRSARRQGTPRGGSLFDHVPEETELESIWQTQRRAAILRAALDHLRETTGLEEKTIHAFELIACRGRTPDQVSGALGMSRNDVYLAKNRVASRVRSVAEDIENLYDEDG